MSCFYCERGDSAATAVATCKWCGAAVCRTHVRQIHYPLISRPFGRSHAAVEMVCLNCLSERRHPTEEAIAFDVVEVEQRG